MKLEKCLVGTLAEMQEAQRIVDKALGYPKKGRHVGGGKHTPIQEEWDGVGEVPPGWTKTASEPVVGVDGTAYLALTHEEMKLLRPKLLAKLSARERSVVAALRNAPEVNLRDIVNAAKVAEEAGQPAPVVEAETPKGIGKMVAIGVGVATLAAAAYEIAQQLGLLN
jgi:hypothetical protein